MHINANKYQAGKYNIIFCDNQSMFFSQQYIPDSVFHSWL